MEKLTENIQKKKNALMNKVKGLYAKYSDF